MTTFRELPQQLGASKRGRAALKESGPEGAAVKEGEAEDLLLPQLEGSPSEVKQAVALKKNLLEKVKKEPATASRLIQNWMRQEAKS
jgi:flagellar biosynthesis/type III secretory pathway M-ring protein FliF/YscJ